MLRLSNKLLKVIEIHRVFMEDGGPYKCRQDAGGTYGGLRTPRTRVVC